MSEKKVEHVAGLIEAEEMSYDMVPESFRCMKCDHLNMYDQLYICERFMSADVCDQSMRGAQIIDDPTAWFCPALENNGNREDRW